MASKAMRIFFRAPGRTMASTFFSILMAPLDFVASFAVLSEVQAQLLITRTDTHADEGVNGFEDQHGSQAGKGGHRKHCFGLNKHQAWVSMQKPVGAGGVDGLAGKKARGQGAESPPHAMHAKGVQ